MKYVQALWCLSLMNTNSYKLADAVIVSDAVVSELKPYVLHQL